MDEGKSKMLSFACFIIAIVGAVGTMLMMNAGIQRALIYLTGGVAIILLIVGIFSYFNYKKLHDERERREKEAGEAEKNNSEEAAQ